MTVTRNIFYISDRTDLTAENISEALLNQFGNIELKRATYSFIDTTEKARSVVDIANRAAESWGRRLIAFVSVVNNETRRTIKGANASRISFFDIFLGELEKELNAKVTVAHHGHRGTGNIQRYNARMETVNFSLNHDDGVSDKNLKEVDVVLMGVSRPGEAPTCLCLALQYGIRVVNYPLIPNDLELSDLPRMVKPYKNKLSGLTTQPERLQAIRQECRPNSTHSKIDTCRSEIFDAQSMFKRHGIPFINIINRLTGELVIYILQVRKLKRRF